MTNCKWRDIILSTEKEVYMRFKKLEEASASKIYSRLTDSSSCAIISPYRGEYSEAENKQRMTKLKSEVRNGLKLGFNQFVSRWVEDGEAFDEESLLIPNITLEQAMKLGQQFEQSSIIFKDSDSCREICTTPFVDGSSKFGVGDVVRNYYNVGDHVMNISDAKEIFAKRRGGPVSMPKKGSNKQPFTLRTVESFELYEVFAPRPSYMETKNRLEKII